MSSDPTAPGATVTLPAGTTLTLPPGTAITTPAGATVTAPATPPKSPKMTVEKLVGQYATQSGRVSESTRNGAVALIAAIWALTSSNIANLKGDFSTASALAVLALLLDFFQYYLHTAFADWEMKKADKKDLSPADPYEFPTWKRRLIAIVFYVKPWPLFLALGITVSALFGSACGTSANPAGTAPGAQSSGTGSVAHPSGPASNSAASHAVPPASNDGGTQDAGP